jgi:hypothetical protein
MNQQLVQPITEFRRFVDGLREARAEHHVGLPHCRISDEEAFGDLQAHLARRYEAVEPVHTFLDAAGTVFDCIPVEQQLSLRGHGGALPRPPHLPEAERRHSDADNAVGFRAVQLHERFTDPLGNQMLAPLGTIPVQRVGLAEVMRFANVGELLRHPSPMAPKGKTSAPTAPTAPPPAPVSPSNPYRTWAQYYQDVDNIGGGSTLSIWSPAVTGAPQLMSLGQVWFQAGTGAQTQTVEAGWQVNTYRYHHALPVLFIMWTPDDYKTGCYNLLCSGFVQTSGAWMLGGAFPFWSTPGGAQIEIRLSWLLQEDRWWLFIDGNAFGYYPVSIFNGGAMADKSTRILFGGEATTLDISNWPPMGSGIVTTPTFGQVAYQRQIKYYSAISGQTHNPTLQDAGFPKFCYAATVKKYGAPWGDTVWYGGKAGANCG